MRTALVVLGDLGMYLDQWFGIKWGFKLYEWCWDKINRRDGLY